MSLARICRERGDGKLSLAKEIEEELELLCDAIASVASIAIDALDQAVIFTALKKITFQIMNLV